MTALAAVADLEIRLGTVLEGTDLARAQAALEDVSVEVLAVAGTDWDDQSVPDIVRVIVLTAAKRIFSNPQGLAGEQLGEYSWRLPGGVAGTTLTDDECRKVITAAGLSTVGSAQVRLPDNHIVNLRSG